MIFRRTVKEGESALNPFCSFLLPLFILPPFLLSALPAPAAEPVVLIRNNWTSQIVLSEILAGLIRRTGGTVKFHPSSIRNQWGDLVHGTAHIQVEVW